MSDNQGFFILCVLSFVETIILIVAFYNMEIKDKEGG